MYNFTPRVLQVIFAPFKPQNDPYSMTVQVASALEKASKGIVKYRVEETIKINDYPRFADGRKYDAESYQRALNGNAYKNGIDWAMIDYAGYAKEWQAYLYDEVWMWGAGYFGFYESRMVGERPFWVNAPPLEVKRLKPKIFMGFNYERETDMALHAYGHRVESIMRRANPIRWQAWLNQVGTVHTAKGQTGEYSYGDEGHANYIQRWHENIFADWWRVIAYPYIVA